MDKDLGDLGKDWGVWAKIEFSGQKANFRGPKKCIIWYKYRISLENFFPSAHMTWVSAEPN